MSYTVVTVKRFGGLQLSADKADVGLEAATDALNVDFDADRSKVFTREGSTLLTAANALSMTDCKVLLPARFAGTDYLLAVGHNASTTGYLDRVNNAGTVVAVGNWAITSGAKPQAVMFGTASTTYVFVAFAGATLRKYDGTTLSTAGTGKPLHIAVTPWGSNRLVQGNFQAAADEPAGGTLGSPSTVFFSDPDAPETYTDTHVHLRHGDGEQIRGMVTWRDLLFVFKETRAFVFYGESGDPVAPTFDYRQISLPSALNLDGANFVSVGVGTDGVYYMANDGVYFTTGGQPTRVSQPIDTVFSDATSGSFPFGLSVAQDRILFNWSVAGATYKAYVLDERHGQWLEWRFQNHGAITSNYATWPAWPYQSERSLFFATGNEILRTTKTVSTDTSGTAIASSYQTGFSDLGVAAQKIIRQAQVWGVGAPTFAYAKDYAAAGSGAAVTLGTSPAVDDALYRVSERGTLFGFKVSASSGAWTVNEVDFHIRSSRAAGLRG